MQNLTSDSELEPEPNGNAHANFLDHFPAVAQKRGEMGAICHPGLFACKHPHLPCMEVFMAYPALIEIMRNELAERGVAVIDILEEQNVDLLDKDRIVVYTFLTDILDDTGDMLAFDVAVNDAALNRSPQQTGTDALHLVGLIYEYVLSRVNIEHLHLS